MRTVKFIALLVSLMSMLVAPVQASRIKDIASVQGIRDNQLIGYGLVVGLPGTGEQTPFTDQTFRTMLGNFGINIP
ncbi:MAG TPA: flagellar biosynthesis protein FlgI, partial [Idiomarina abyssalis]